MLFLGIGGLHGVLLIRRVGFYTVGFMDRSIVTLVFYESNRSEFLSVVSFYDRNSDQSREMNKKSITDNFDAIWQRISFETGIKSLRQLAVIIDKKQPTISAAKAKGDFPPGWAYLVGIKYGLLTEWIMTGEGPKRLSEGGEMNPLLTGEERTRSMVQLEDEPKGGRKFDIINEVEEWLGEEVRRNPKKEIWFEVEMQESFSSFKEWKRKRDQQKSGEYTDTTRKVA